MGVPVHILTLGTDTESRGFLMLRLDKQRARISTELP